jgi:hypothetical protein
MSEFILDALGLAAVVFCALVVVALLWVVMG